MKGASNVTLAQLIDAGVIEPGEQVLTVTVGGPGGTNTFIADLLENGDIIYNDKLFKSPSSWSLHVKRLVNPSRLADDGWTSVKYRGELLKAYRPQRPLEGSDAEAEGLAGGDAGPKRKRPRRPVPRQHAISNATAEEEEEQFDGFEEDPLPSDGERGFDSDLEADEPHAAVMEDDYSHGPISEPENPASPADAAAVDAYGGHDDAASDEALEFQHESVQAASPATQVPPADAATADTFPAEVENSQPPSDSEAVAAAPLHMTDPAAAQPGSVDDDMQPSEPHTDEQLTTSPPAASSPAAAHLAAEQPASYPVTEQPDGPPALHRGGMAGTGSEWIACDECGKWRQAAVGNVARGPWTCSMNLDTRFASCEVPQEMTDEEIDAKLDAESLAAQTFDHATLSRRAPLDQVTAKDFEADLVQFLEGIGEDRLAKNVRGKHVGCNNTPIDMLGLYKSVVAHGGLAANEAYDPAGRYAGTINWAGDIFPSMSNHKRGHRATSIGTQLLSNYRKYLAAYERAWAAADLPEHPLQPGSGGLAVLVEDEDGDGDALAEAADADDDAGAALRAGSRQARKARSRYRATGDADVNGPPGPTDEEWQPLATSRPRRQRKRRGSPWGDDHDGSAEPEAPGGSRSPAAGEATPEADAAPTPAAAARPKRAVRAKRKAADRERQQSEPREALAAEVPPLTEQQMEATAADLAACQGDPGRPQPGTLLLAQGSSSPANLWPVVVATGSHLPVRVAGGGAQGCGGAPVLAPLAQAAGSGRVTDALPAVALGSCAVGWVATDSCRPFDEALAQPAAEAIAGPEGGAAADGGRRSQALKLAVQLHRCGQEAAAAAVVEAAGARQVAARLAALEATLPLAALQTGEWAPWAAWRRSLGHAESAAGLAPLVVDLTMALRAEALLPGMADLEQQLRHRLQADGPPTVFGMDQAVRGIWHAINWQMLHGVATGSPATAAAPISTAASGAAAAKGETAAAGTAAQPSPTAASAPEPPAPVPAVVQAAAPAAAEPAQASEPQAADLAAAAAPQLSLHVPSTAVPPQVSGLQWAEQDAFLAQLALAQRHQQQQQFQQQYQQQLYQQQRQQQQQQAMAQAYQQQAYMQPPQLLADDGPLHDEEDGQQGDVPLGRGHRKKAPSSRINLAVQGDQVLIQLREQPKILA